MSFKKDEELGVGSFYQDKTSVIQEARVFNETPISPRKCRILLTKVIYLLYTGQTFSSHEATTLFFGATKLFQHKDPALRQMVYLAIKELCPLAEDTIMVTASIMKDMQPNMEVIYRPNAIRALSRVVDPSMVQGLERFFKSAIVDRNSSISSAALVSAYQLNVAARDVVRRWGNEAQEALNAKPGGSSGLSTGLSGAGGIFGYGSSQSNQSYQVIPSSSYINQYHALGLLYLIRAGDRMAVTRLVQQLSGASGGRGGSSASHALRSPFAVCMLVRYAARIADEDPNLRPAMMELLENWLRHRADMVNLEAARAISELKGITDTEVHRCITILQLFLSSPRPTLKFAAIRSLARLSNTVPKAVASCNVDLEALISDPNRSVATYAITTLLKTGNEASVDRLMKQISTFMADISDEFKVVVVDAIRSLCLKFPAKQGVMLGFLSGVLRDEGGYEFKRAVVEAIFDMIKFVPEAKESALAHLCEFIEDCEFTKLSVRILHLLGVEGPRMPNPHKYIRYIYNRVILENAIVRAAAVASLAKFGARSNDKSLQIRIAVLLRRCLDDVDDEVRDRAAMYVRVVGETTASSSAQPVKLEPDTMASRLVNDDATFQLSILETQLASYVAQPMEQTAPFDASAVPRVTREQSRAEALRSKAEAAAKVAMAADKPKAGPSSVASSAPAAVAAAPVALGQGANAASAYAATLSAIPQFKGYGALLKSSAKPQELIESGLEYTVSVVKHIYASHVVLQFNVANTDFEKVVLENVEMFVAGAEDLGLTEDFIIPVPSLSATTPSDIIYVSFTRAEDSFPQGLLSCTLRYTSKEWDPNTQAPEEEGYPDEYAVEDTELAVADYVEGTYVDFNKEWEAAGADNSTTDTFALTALESLDAACSTLIDLFGLSPLGGTERPSSTSVHTLNLSGLVPRGQAAGGPVKVLARARMTFSPSGADKGVTMELSVRSPEEAVRNLVMGAIA